MDLDNHSERLHVERRHDGVFCKTAPGGVSVAEALMLVPLLAVPATGGMYWLGALPMEVPITLAGLGAVFSLALAMHRRSGSEIEVTPRWVTIGNRGYGGNVEVKFALEDIKKVFIASPKDDYSGKYLVFDDGDEQTACFAGIPERDLVFVRDLVMEAREARERRQEVEGKEYRFEQVAPEKITDLVER